MLSCNVVIAVWVKSGRYRRAKKLYVDRRLTAFYRKTGRIPPIGFVLKSGDVIIEKGCDEESIVLFINPKNKKNGI